MNHVKAAYTVYTGKGVKSTKDELSTMIDAWQQRTGANLNGMPVLAGTTQFFRNMGRSYIPKTMRQVPGRIARTVLLPMSLPGALVSSATHNDNFYSGMTGTVNVNNDNPGTLAHEVGHWVDMERGQAPVHRSYAGTYDRHYMPFNRLMAEVNATSYARQALGEPDWKKTKPHLTAALTTYLYSVHDFLTRFAKQDAALGLGPKNQSWQKMVTTAVGDPNLGNFDRQKLVAHAMLKALGGNKYQPDPLMYYKPMPVVQTPSGVLKWTDKRTRPLVALAGGILDAEYKYSQQQKKEKTRAGKSRGLTADSPTDVIGGGDASSPFAMDSKAVAMKAACELLGVRQ